MIPTFCCGFECGQLNAATYAGQHWQNNNASISTTTVRNGARSLRCNPVAGSAYASANAANSGYHTSGTRHVGRVAFYFVTLPSLSTRLIQFGFFSGGPSVFFQASDSKIYAAIATSPGATGFTVTTGQWYIIDYDFNVNTSGSDFCDARVNGTALGQATGTGTSSSDTSQDSVGFIDTTTGECFVDDVIQSSTAADYPIGDGYVNHFVPTSDGTHNVAGANDFERGTLGTDIINTTTDAYLLIDEVPLDDTTPDTNDFINMIAPPGAGDYVQCKFGPAPGISTPTVGPRAVEAIIGIHQAGTGTGNMRVRLDDNGSAGNIWDATTVAGTTTIIYKRAHFAVPPSQPFGGPSVWEIGGNDNGDFNNLRIDFGSPVGGVDANPDQYLDCAMIEAEFAAVVGGGGGQATRSMHQYRQRRAA